MSRKNMANHKEEQGPAQAMFSRRDFLKLVIFSGSALAIVKFINSEATDIALATEGTGPYYYGTDTSWAVDTKGTNASNFPQNFYIGRTGVETVMYNDAAFYNVAADKAGKLFTHTYWLVKGPYYKYRGTRTPYQYGYDQGEKAAWAWSNHNWSNKIGGKTIFADIEEGTSTDPQSDYFDGWRDYVNGNEYVNITDNRALLEGFLDAIKDYDSSFNPGTYTRTDLWQSWFNGADYDPQRPFVVWLGGNACSISCSPCDNCTTAKTEADSDFSSKLTTAFGRYNTVIWQFYISECPAPDCADYDIARQSGYIRFTPVTTKAYIPMIKHYQPITGMLGPYPAPGQDSSLGEEATPQDAVRPYPLPNTDP